MLDKDCFLSVVAPLHNDADIVAGFVADLIHVLSTHYANYEILLVDDGSRDDTIRLVEQLLHQHKYIRLLQLSRSFGQEIAISAGLDAVIGDFVVVMLPDSDPPDLIPQMVEQSRQGSGIVFGIRQHRHQEPALLRVGANFFYWYCNAILDMNIPKNTTHFRVLSRQAVNALIQIKDRLRYLSTLSAYVGYSNQSFVYQPVNRRAKPRVKTLWEGVNLAVNMIVANSLRPLRLVSWLAFLLSGLNILYIGYVLFIRFSLENVAPGWATLSLQTSGMFFFLFLITAILCEYIGRILDELKGRPLYYVMNEQNSSVLATQENEKNVVTESVWP